MLTEKNLLIKWKRCEVIEMHDEIRGKFDWQRIAILKYKSKLYYTVINSDLTMKVVPMEEMPWEYRDGKFYDKDDTSVLLTEIEDKLKKVDEADNK